MNHMTRLISSPQYPNSSIFIPHHVWCHCLVDAASLEKERLEEKQRSARKERSKDEEEWSTRWVQSTPRSHSHWESRVSFITTLLRGFPCRNMIRIDLKNIFCVDEKAWRNRANNLVWSWMTHAITRYIFHLDGFKDSCANICKNHVNLWKI